MYLSFVPSGPVFCVYAGRDRSIRDLLQGRRCQCERLADGRIRLFGLGATLPCAPGGKKAVWRELNHVVPASEVEFLEESAN